jgi:hypothetical protein
MIPADLYRVIAIKLRADKGQEPTEAEKAMS